MTYTLAHDRDIEYGYLRARLPKGKGTALDFGPQPAAPTAQFAIDQGYSVRGLGLEPQRFEHPSYTFTYGDILSAPLVGPYDWILNVSTVEHVGLAGRYGVCEDIPDGDLRAMMRLRELMGPTSKQILVIPVGFDCIASPWHRVYGSVRLAQLLRGYKVLHEAYWNKGGDDDTAWRSCSRKEALKTMPIIGPPNYYAIGGFVLERAEIPTRHYCTLFDENYLDRGLALHESMERHCQPYQLWVLALTERTAEILAQLALPNVTVVPLSELETAELRAAREGRTWQEYVWTLTGTWMLDVLKRAPEISELSYMDSDCYFYADPQPVYDELGAASIGITPHRSSPFYRAVSITNGFYNVGMLYVKRDESGLGCLREWAQQCIEWCYLHVEPGRYCDQKYLDNWPGKWGAWPIWHKGANLAPWNQGEGQYRYTRRQGRIYVDGEPLLWFHFHKRLLPLGPHDHRLDPFVAHYIYGPYKEALEAAVIRAAEAEYAIDHRDDSAQQ